MPVICAVKDSIPSTVGISTAPTALSPSAQHAPTRGWRAEEGEWSPGSGIMCAPGTAPAATAGGGGGGASEKSTPIHCSGPHNTQPAGTPGRGVTLSNRPMRSTGSRAGTDVRRGGVGGAPTTLWSCWTGVVAGSACSEADEAARATRCGAGYRAGNTVRLMPWRVRGVPPSRTTAPSPMATIIPASLCTTPARRFGAPPGKMGLPG